MQARQEIQFDGMTEPELLALADADLEEIVLNGQPISFALGSAQVLGQFQRGESTLVVELGHIDGGGEGVLHALWRVTRAYARSRQIPRVEWLVHAVHCREPNHKLRHVLQRRGFVIRSIDGVSEVYHLVDEVHRPE